MAFWKTQHNEIQTRLCDTLLRGIWKYANQEEKFDKNILIKKASRWVIYTMYIFETHTLWSSKRRDEDCWFLVLVKESYNSRFIPFKSSKDIYQEWYQMLIEWNFFLCFSFIYTVNILFQEWKNSLIIYQTKIWYSEKLTSLLIWSQKCCD